MKKFWIKIPQVWWTMFFMCKVWIKHFHKISLNLAQFYFFYIVVKRDTVYNHVYILSLQKVLNRLLNLQTFNFMITFYFIPLDARGISASNHFKVTQIVVLKTIILCYFQGSAAMRQPRLNLALEIIFKKGFAYLGQV